MNTPLRLEALDPEVKRYKTIGALMRTAAAFGIVAGLVTIGAQAPDRKLVSTNCAYDATATGTLSDASPDLSALCGDSGGRAQVTAEAAKHAVPDAASVLDPQVPPEPQPSTF